MQQDLPNNDIEELANEGWTQMQALLQQHGLEEKRKPIFYYILRIGSIAACLLVSVFIYQYFIHASNKQDETALRGDRQTGPNNSVKEPVSLTPANGKKAIETVQATGIIITKNTSGQKVVSYTHRRIFNTIYVFPEEQVLTREPITLISPGIQMPPREKIMMAPVLQAKKIKINPPLLNKTIEEQPAKNRQKKPIQLYAGLGSNVTVHKDIDQELDISKMNVHPSLRLVIPLNKRLSLHTGLNAMSTLHGKNENAKEKEDINNLGANLYYKINSTSLIKASYFTLPAIMNYKLKKNWNIGAGLQISRLYKFSVKEKEESYDYEGNLVEINEVRYAVNTMLRRPMGNKVTLRKWEPGLVLETSLQKGKFLFSAGYVYGTCKAIKIHQPNGNTNHFRNEYFKLGVQYQIK